MKDRSNPEADIHPLLDRRWSPCSFAETPVPAGDLKSLFEAARWAPSSFNEQPWRFIVATKDQPEHFEKVLSCLVEGNQSWAKRAPVLLLTVASKDFARNGKPNRHWCHDVGLAMSNLSMEATARGLVVHQMAGILPDRATDIFGLPDDCEAVTGVAIGYLADPDDDTVEQAHRDRDAGARERKPLSGIVFGPKWGEGHEVVS